MPHDDFEDFEESGFNDNRGNLRNHDASSPPDMIKITGLSRKKDRNGNTYLIGALNALSQVLVLPNTHKKQENHPDYYLYIRMNPKAMNFNPSQQSSINI